MRGVTFEYRTPPALLILVATLAFSVFLADLFTPLGIAVWIFYLLPLALTLYSRTPMLPLYVAVFCTAAVAMKLLSPFDTASVVDAWVGHTNRTLYMLALWPIAFMVRQLIVVRIDVEQEEWIRRTHAALLHSLLGDLPVEEVATRTLRSLVDAVAAQTGAIYMGGLAGAERIAAHALESEGTPASFGRGEGLVGQALEDGRMSVLREVPEGFLRVDAGIGRSPPAHVAIVPLANEGKPVAVLTLGSLRPWGDVADQLLQRIAGPVGVTLVSARYKARLRELLEESQRLAEELQGQQAVLETQQAELEATNEELNQSNSVMEVQTQELERQRDALVEARRVADMANRYKSEFLASMSHELRTPLNSSLILARLLADNKEGNLNDDQVQSAETIYRAGNDLLALINDILDLAKIEAGRTELVVESVALPGLVEQLERAFRPVATEKKLGLRIIYDDSAPRMLVTDIRRVEQILKNLMSNAFKFTQRGEVELRVAAEGPDHVRCSVRDTGIGIAAEHQEVIFEAFRQADGTTSRKYGGTGLGLSISRELARLLGARIVIESALGHGSTFSLILPRAGVPAESLAPVAPVVDSRPQLVAPIPANARPQARTIADDRHRSTRPGRVILVIEDDAEFGRILHDLAHELDFDCIVATTAAEGLALARDLQPSGILLDVGLPDASGLWVIERLKRDPATRHVPVHVVSASDYVQTALELGAIGYAIKPAAREELIAAVKKLEERQARGLRRVLVVEDDQRQQESIRKLLQGESVELIAAHSVKEALECLERLSIDCMILDLTLPDGSGYDLLEKMAAGTRYSFPPVIVYTGRDLERSDEAKLRRYSRSIIVKGARSPERLLDEVTLFLHQVESTLLPEQQRMLADARQRESVFEGRRILVVEDDVRNIFALSKVLEPRGAKVEIARNGREALEVLERGSGIDLVLMDLMMPEMDGLTATREIRKRAALKDLPIIALTAKAMADDREQALAAGANDYMAKPFEVDRLVSLCRVWLPR